MRIAEVATGKTIGTLTSPEGVHWARFCPNGQRLFVANGRTGCVWDVQTGEIVTPPMEHADEIRHASFSPDGRWIATASKDATARVWDAATGKAITPPLKHASDVHRAAFSPEGKYVATVEINGILRVWTVAQGVAQLLWEAVGAGSVEVRFSPDGGRLVSCNYLRAELRDVKTGGRIAQLAHNGAVYHAVFSPDGQRVATTSEDLTARVWDAATGAPITPPLKHAYVPHEVAFSPDGRFLATACSDGAARVWDLGSSRPLLSWSSPCTLQTLSPDTRYVLGLGDADRSLHLLDSATGKEVRPLWRSASAIGYPSFSPDSRFVVACADQTARLWDIASGKESCAPLKHESEVQIATINPNATRLATGCKDGAVHVWDLSTGKPICQPMRHADSVCSVRFSADSRRLLTAGKDSQARVWDAATGQPIGPFVTHAMLGIDTCHFGTACGPAWSPDGNCLATEILGFTARAWDAATGQPVGPPLNHSGGLDSLTFSPDGRRLLITSNDCTAVQWDVTTGKRLTPAMRHGDFVRDGAYSPDGRRIATVDNTTLRMWDAATGLPLMLPVKLPCSGHLQRLQFAPDGRRLFTWDGHVNGMSIWDTSLDERPIEDLVKLANLVTGHRLDDDGVLTALEREDLRKLWQDLLAKYPAEFHFNGHFSRPWAEDLLQQGNHAEAARLAEKVLGALPKDVNEYQNAAVVLVGCISVAGKDASLSVTNRQAVAQAYADQALQLLEQAAERGLDTVEARQIRQALQLRPDDPQFSRRLGNAFYRLGLALHSQEQYAGAEMEFRATLRLLPDFPEARAKLGYALWKQGKIVEAKAECREALRLRPGDPGAYFTLGLILHYGEKKERVALARFYAEAFAAHPKLGDDLRFANRYNAACNAATSGCGGDKDAARLDDAERARWRRQALDWLRADLAAWGQLLEKHPDQARAGVQRTLRMWQQDLDFAGVRNESLARLPEAERQAWQQLWADVEQTLRRASPEDTKKQPAN